jgi:3',5'-cyclic AMP phosphodiesterase CpdA
LTIAQITDLHITTDKDPLNKRRNELRLREVLRAIHNLKPRPVAIIATGDLVDRGEAEEYVELKAVMAECEIPVYYGVGNHDARLPFLELFEGPQARTDENGFIQYAVDFGDMRMVMIDTLEDGQNDGGFCEKRAGWLARALDEEPSKPTVLALHHPPIPSGIQWMDSPPGAPWAKRLAQVLKGRDQIRVMVSGHLHRGYLGLFAGHVSVAAPATSIQLTLDLTSVDLRRPDGREILVEEPPGFALIVAIDGELITHMCVAGEYAPAVTYNFPFRRD